MSEKGFVYCEAGTVENLMWIRCKEEAQVKCGACCKWLCGKHAFIAKDSTGVRCEKCSKQPQFCGECPSCEEGHYERCTGVKK